MAQLKRICKKIVLIIITISLLITFCAMPSSYAKLDLQDGEFYYAGTQKGQYTVSDGIFKWLLSKIGDIADWILGIITMGFRMVFVGWTALIEKMLTWALETTSGITMSGDIVESNTDITSITDSANNVTLGAIVYNHVPALDSNIFNLEEDIEDLKYSGTGRLLVCKECCTEPNEDVTKCCNEDGTHTTDTEMCSCEGNCSDCKAYLDAVKKYNERKEDAELNPPIIYQVKEAVATWYYIIRMLALSAMLVLLIFIGIKMAISTVASEKSVYKKMLVDWLVGLIIIFSMHYIMLFTFYMNEILVETIEKSADAVHSVKMKELAEKDSMEGVEYTNADLEIKVYEAVRTRAYDAKLLNGISGMVMYMTMVYFAFRYTLIYLKRLLTTIILAVMSPALGVGYALQKALTGKQQVLGNWLKEFVLNVIIQSVHAIIYAVFISQALVLSLQSIAGLIVAMILMNYTLKADSLFRKIFKISTGLLEDTNNAEDKFKAGLQDAFIGGKAAVNTLVHESPYTKGVAGIGKAVLATPVLAGTLINRNRRRNALTTISSEDAERNSNTEQNSNNTNETEQQGNNQNTNGNRGNGNNSKSRKKLPVKSDEELLQTGKKTLKSNVDKTKEKLINAKTPQEQKDAMDQHMIATDEFNRYNKLTTPTTGQIALGHMKRIYDIENTFILKQNSSGTGILKDFKSNSKEIYRGIYGNTYRDPITGKKVNDGTGYYTQFKPENLFGLTDGDKKILSAQFQRSFGAISGMASMFLGMGTMVAHPKVGLGALAGGYSLTKKGLGSRKTSMSSYTGKYTFSKFGIPTMKNIRKATLAKAQREYNDLMISDVKHKHPELYKGLKIGTITATTVALTGGGIIVTAAALGAGLVGGRFIAKTNLGQGYEDMDAHLRKQQKKQEKEFKKESLDVIKAETQARMIFMINQERNGKYAEQEKKDLYETEGYIYDLQTGTITKKEKTSNEAKKQEAFDNKLEVLLMAKETENNGNGSNSNPDVKVQNNVIEDKIIVNNIIPSKISQADIRFIDKEIDNILVKMSGGRVLDMDNQATLNKAMNELTDRLVVAGLINDTQKAEVVFKEGKTGLKKALKEKADLTNAKIEVAAQALEGIVDEDKDKIKESIKEISENKNITDFKQITAQDVLDKLTNPNNQNGNNQNNSQPKVFTKEERKEYNEKISKYLESLELAKKSTHTSAFEKRNAVKMKINNQVMPTENKRKKKLEQILEMSFDTNMEDPTGALIDQIDSIKNTGGVVTDQKGNIVKVSSAESNRALELLFLRKELEELNTVAIKELDWKKGSYAFTKATKAKNEAAVNYYHDELKIQNYILNNQTIYKDKDYRIKTDKYTQEQIKQREDIAELEKNLQSKKRDMEIKERIAKNKGPIVDLDVFKEQLLGDKK